MSTILVVDDNEINLRLLERIISNNTSCNVISATNGEEAVEMALKEKPFLIFMDMMMPVVDGYQATEKIKSIAELKDIPIVAVTAVNTKEGIKKIFDCGCEDILQKPISINTIVQLIEKHMKV
ncbi:MAG: response regulator [Spirochaetota bacterium]|nr:response regulator [Spirochaetota bacterium]